MTRLSGLLAAAAIVVTACSSTGGSAEPSAAASEGAGGGSFEQWVPDEALLAAAKEEGTLSTIALPRSWCNYGESIDTFKERTGLGSTSSTRMPARPTS
jgi:putative spermidine/putrescine transport system substrate-binding protein